MVDPSPSRIAAQANFQRLLDGEDVRADGCPVLLDAAQADEGQGRVGGRYGAFGATHETALKGGVSLTGKAHYSKSQPEMTRLRRSGSFSSRSSRAERAGGHSAHDFFTMSTPESRYFLRK